MEKVALRHQFLPEHKPFPGAVFVRLFIHFFAVANTIVYSTRTLPQLKSDARELWMGFNNHWPDDAVVKFDNDKMNLTGAETFVLPFPDDLTKKYELPTNAILVSNTLGSANDSATKAATIALPQNINAIGPDSSYQEQSWQAFDLNGISIQKSSFTDYNNQFNETLDGLGVTSIIFVFFSSWIFLLLGRVVVLFIYAWIVQGLLFFTGNRLKFGNVYRIGLLLLPISEEIILLAKILYPSLNILSFWMVWLLLAAAVAITNRKQLDA